MAGGGLGTEQRWAESESLHPQLGTCWAQPGQGKWGSLPGVHWMSKATLSTGILIRVFKCKDSAIYALRKHALL